MFYRLLSALLLGSLCASSAYARRGPQLDADEQRMLEKINELRVQSGNGTPPLKLSASLQKVAAWMAQDLATRADKVFSHEDSQHQRPSQRIYTAATNANRLNRFACAENLTAGVESGEMAYGNLHDACDPDPKDPAHPCTYAHRKNMLNPAFKTIGIKRYYSEASQWKWYWVTDFSASDSAE